MEVFKLPTIVHEKFFTKTDQIVFPHLLKRLNTTKTMIDANPSKWNISKKCINDYEYVYTSSFSRDNICTKKPISRSYFKIIEIMKHMNIDGKLTDCIAESPGGFIEYFLEMGCSINAISLISDDNNIPHWNHNIINDKRVCLLNGLDDTGDIYKLKNILHYVKHSGKNRRDIVTGDGGFDYTSDFSKQELDSYPLIYSEVLMSLLLLKRGGVFICKIFDIMYLKTIKLLYLLRISFETMHIVKPSMSRNTNSEKYIVCKGYNGYNMGRVNLMIHNYQMELPIDIPICFVDTINTFNNQYTTKQIREIQRGVNMNKEVISRQPTKRQLMIGNKWCRDLGLGVVETFSNYRSTTK